MMLSPLIRRGWSPMNELLRLTDDLNYRSVFPAISATQTDAAVSVRAEIPGFSPDDVSLSIEGNRLTIAGEQPGPETTDDATPETTGNGGARARKFQRVLTLPYRVDADRAEAKVEHGVLVVHIPRASDELPKRIEIKTS